MPPKKPKKGKGREAEALPASYDELVEAADKEEGQGTRYQFGEKAVRHYEGSLSLYRQAANFPGISAEEAHDALYNAARIMYTLATEVYSVEPAYQAILESINTYRQCLTIQPGSIDAAFNLAQALHTLGEFVSDGVAQSGDLASLSSASLWTEARKLLQQVAEAQIAKMIRFDSAAPSSTQEDGNASTPVAEEEAAGEMQEETVVLETAITASTVIETLLAAIGVDISLSDETDEDMSQELESLVRKTNELDEQEGHMKEEILKAKHDVVRAVLERKIGGVLPAELALLEGVVEEQSAILSAGRRPNPSDVTELADSLLLRARLLLASQHTIQASDAAAQNSLLVPILQQAQGLYEQACTTLQNPLQRPAATPTHHIPSLLSSNLLSQAEVATALACLAARQGGDGSEGDVRYLLGRAQTNALQALDIAAGPFKQASHSSAHAPRFAKTSKSAAREDYRTILTTQQAALSIMRTQLAAFLLFHNVTMPDEDKRSLQALLKGIWPNVTERSRIFAGCFEKEQDGLVDLLVRSLSTTRTEQEVWSAFLQDV